MKRLLSSIINFLFVVFLLFSCKAFAFELAKSVHEIKLQNGMRWLLVERHQAPVFSGVVMVRVGGADEDPDKTGLAHVFEHMAFKGSSEIGTKDFKKEKPILGKIEEIGARLTALQTSEKPDPEEIKKLKEEMTKLSKEAASYQIKNEVWELMVRNGAADLNAYTSKDVTAYHASMPINKLPLWMSVVSQMVSDPVYREFYTERSVILEERRAGVENNPDGKMSEILLESAFQKSPYRWPVIGSVEDVASFTIADARAFHNRYYTAGNMVGVLVGDFSSSRVRTLLEKYFGLIPPSKQKEKDGAYEDKGGGEKKFKFNAGPAVAIAYHKPTLPDPDEFTFDVMEVLLCDGPTSRLEKRLVYDEKAARVIYCSDSFPGSRLNNLFLFWAEPNRSSTPEKIAAKIEEELDRLKTEPVSDEELTRVRKKVMASVLYALEKNMGLAMALADFETIFGDWRLLADYPKKIEQVSASDIMRVANKYFINEGKTTIIREKGK
jgi:predicted Zn-dependent peptidase